MERRILNVVNSSRRPLKKADIIKSVNAARSRRKDFNKVLESLVTSGKIVERNGRYGKARRPSGDEATVLNITDRFGFARPINAVDDVFIPGRYLKGAMPGDTVELEVSKSSSGSLKEGKVTKVITQNNPDFSGTLVQDNQGNLAVLPDKYVGFLMLVDKKSYIKGELGDKVLAQVSHREERHSGHRVLVKEVFGSSEHAYICAKAILAENKIETQFTPETIEQAKEIAADETIHPKEIAVRTDLRDEMIFTIDGADTKDIDDAISLKTSDKGWELGVHIADVSYYVTRESPMDKEAYNRGTSVYYADQVVPMLPTELSNGICSLNPSVDRLAFSAIIDIREDGQIMDYRFEKTVIRSHMQGVYSEVNAILNGEKITKSIEKKYKDVTDIIKGMEVLASVLNRRRQERHAVNLSSKEAKIVVEDNIPVDIVDRTTGISENIIEEFMLCANECAASYATEKSLPFIYRVHQDPQSDRLEALYQLLDSLGIPYTRVKAGQSVAPSIEDILKETKNTDLEVIVNYAVLRTMAKAKYSADNLGHFGLGLKNYAHFTAPIRRYSDLAVHRILTSLHIGMRRENIEKYFREWVENCSTQSTIREISSMNAERSAEDCYKAEYMKKFVGEDISGIVSSVTSFGIFIQLENTVEGLISLENFPSGRWVYDNLITYSNAVGGARIRLGDKVKIQVAKANVPAGQVDFIFANPEQYQAPDVKDASTSKKADAKKTDTKKVVPRVKRK